MKQIRISWKDTATNNEGHGSWFDEKDREMLEANTKHFNNEYPQIKHWIEADDSILDAEVIG